MENFAAAFRRIVTEYPEVIEDRKLLKSILSDVFPQDQREINLLLTGFDIRVMDLVNGRQDDLFIRRAILKNRLMKEHGITSTYAVWIIDTWLYALGDDTITSTDRTLPPTCEEDFLVLEQDGMLEIVQYKGNQTEITVPSTIEEKPVRIIGDRAFRGNATIKRVVLEDGIRLIRGGAFSGCTQLEEIDLPNSLESIGEMKGAGKTVDDGAFAGAGIRDIELPRNLHQIGVYTFADSALESITLPNSVQEIGKGAFEGCLDLISAELPPELYCIPHSMFKKCRKLSTVKFPNDLYEISGSAFAGCQSLTEIELPHRLVEMGSGVFAGCKSLEKLYIPHTVVRISDSNSFNSYIYTYSTPSFGGGKKALTVYCHPKSFARKYANAFSMQTEDWKK